MDNSRINMDNSKIDKSRLSGVGENRNMPRKGVSPFSGNHQQQQQYQQHKYH